MHITVVYNPQSGTALSRSALEVLFHDASIAVDAFIELNQSTKRKLKKFIDAGAIIATIGGDGTISAVAGMLTGTKATLLPLPGGTLNHFTKDLGIDQDLAAAIKNVHHGKVHDVDVATVNDVVFINNSSIGLYPTSLRDRNRFEDRLGKWPAAIIASIRSLINFRTYEVVINGASITTPFVFIGNNKYDVRPGNIGRKHLDQGTLSVLVINAKSRLDILKILPFALVGRTEQHERFDIFTAAMVSISTKKYKRIHVSHDGELSLVASPLKYKVNRKSLKVLI